MTSLSPSQIASYAQQAGFSGNSLSIAIAVAMAESGGNTTATHVNTNGTVDRGLWQINSVHSQYNATMLLSSPLYNAQAAYAISSRGSNWNPWTTFTSGAYKRYMTGTGTTLPNTGQKPWYAFPRIDNFGQIDPQGPYYKPDSNILTPSGYPVTALLPGTVTSVARTSWGQTVITIRLDSPLNTLATHEYYEHMHNANVRVGQHVASGTLIGNANYTGEGANLGFGLYSGDVYGSGAAWAVLQNDLRPGGAGLLNPVKLLNSAASGSLSVGTGGVSSSGGVVGAITTVFGATPTYIPLTSQVHNTLVNAPGFYAIALALDEAEQFPGWIDLTQPISVDLSTSIAGQSVGPGNIAIPDIVGLARSMGATVTDNMVPFTIRAGTVSLGFVLLTLLVLKLTGPIMAQVAPILAAA